MSEVLACHGLRGHFQTRQGPRPVLEGVDLTLRAGEITALVGKSGAGKSVLARSLLRLPEPGFRLTAGEIRFEGTDLVRASEAYLRQIRGSRLALVFQDARGALNPLATVGEHLAAVARARRLDGAAAVERQRRAFEQVGLGWDDRLLGSYAHQLSGGTCQRIQLALVLLGQPAAIVLDEPTSQLDVTVQAGVSETIRQIVATTGAAVLLIAHDLGLIARLANRVAVMAGGRIVEEGETQAIFRSPQHPETQGLLAEARARAAWLLEEAPA